MKRIFTVRLNVDDMCADLDLIDGEQARSDWLKGFQVGVRGGPSRWSEGSPGHMGWTLGNRSHVAARALQEAQQAGGRVSADARDAKYGTKIPLKSLRSEARSEARTGDRSGHEPIEISSNPVIQEPASGVSSHPPPQLAAAATPACDFELYTKPDPTATVARRLTLGDLEARHLVLLVGREDRDKARTLFDLHGWESCSEALTHLETVARARPPGKQRVMVSEFGQYLDSHYSLEAVDYKRAGLPIPVGLMP